MANSKNRSPAGIGSAHVSRPIELFLATGNTGKVHEIRRLTAGWPIKWLNVGDLTDWQDPDETGESFLENALIKAACAFQRTGIASLADDSGLLVDALGGLPGIHSARFAGIHGDSRANMELLLSQLDGVDQPFRSARFSCVIALLLPIGHPLDVTLKLGFNEPPIQESKLDSGNVRTVAHWTRLNDHPLLPRDTFAICGTGTVEGEISRSPVGNGGFGYDPIFYYPPLGATFAELPLETKNELSHRYQALSAVLAWVKEAVAEFDRTQHGHSG